MDKFAANLSHDMNIWASGGLAPLILNLKTGLWRLVSFTPRPPYSRGKRPPYTLNRRLGGHQTAPGSLWGQKYPSSIENGVTVPRLSNP